MIKGDSNVRRVLPESVVWLYSNNRVEEAERVIRHAAKLNNIAMPGSMLTARSLEIIVPSVKSTTTTNGVKLHKVTPSYTQR